MCQIPSRWGGGDLLWARDARTFSARRSTGNARRSQEWVAPRSPHSLNVACTCNMGELFIARARARVCVCVCVSVSVCVTVRQGRGREEGGE